MMRAGNFFLGIILDLSIKDQQQQQQKILSPWLMRKTAAETASVTSARALNRAAFNCFVFLKTSTARTQPSTPTLEKLPFPPIF